MSEQTKLETALLGLLQRAEGPYRRALAMIEMCLPDPDPAADEISDCLSRLEPLMRQAQEIEVELAPRRQEWIERGYKPDSSTRQVFADHQKLLGSLLEKIHRLEQRMLSLRQKAKPEVDTWIRHQQMQRAYQQASR